MRIRKLKAANTVPIRNLEVDNLGNVVIVAGANGSGKTNLKRAIVKVFQSPQSPLIEVTVESTRPEEESAWGMKHIELKPDSPNQEFQSYMQSRTRGGTYTGSVIQIDSDRSVQPVKFQAISLSTPDPDDTDLDYNFFLNPFVNRWQEIVNKIFQKVANRDFKIAQYVKNHPDKTNAETLELFPDTFSPFQELFARLLPGKTLETIDPKEPKGFLYRVGDSQVLPFATLSSGEQEVVKIAFDLVWKRIRHCVILVDEPELHLHPTLTFRLIETLKSLGNATNQFLFFTHSADLVSTYYSSGDVFFIDTDDLDGNQAKRLSMLDEHHVQTARAMGDKLGLFAVGKKLVFVEGNQASIDRLTYHRIAILYFPEAYILPTGSVENILALNRLAQELQESIFGMDFFMVRDRDGLTHEHINALENNRRIRCLRRRHIENYFLDEEVLARVAAYFYLDDSLRQPANVEAKLLEIARSVLPQAILLALKEFVSISGVLAAPRIPYTHEKSQPEVEAEFISSTNESLTHLNEICSESMLSQKFTSETTRCEESLSNNTWKVVFPGKVIFSQYCGLLGQDANRVRQAYLDIALSEKPQVFGEIQKIFEDFSQLS